MSLTWALNNLDIMDGFSHRKFIFYLTYNNKNYLGFRLVNKIMVEKDVTMHYKFYSNLFSILINIFWNLLIEDLGTL